MNKESQEFVQLLTQVQSSLYAYILSLVLDHAKADDLLQETNLTLWNKADQFEAGTHFLAWACKVAYFKVLSHRRSQARDRHVFNDELLDFLAEQQIERSEQQERRREALRHCIKRLSTYQQQLLAARYQAGGSVKDMAMKKGRTVGVISQTLYRIRCTLNKCIEARIAAEQLP